LAEVTDLIVDDRCKKRIEEGITIFNEFTHISHQLFVQIVISKSHLLGLLTSSDELWIIGICTILLFSRSKFGVISVHINQSSLSL